MVPGSAFMLLFDLCNLSLRVTYILRRALLSLIFIWQKHVGVNIFNR